MLLAIIEMGRPPNAIVGSLAIFIGASMATGSPPTFLALWEFATIMLIGALITFSIMIVNDIIDLEADRINAPWRPLPSGRVSARAAGAAAAIFAVTAVALSALIEPRYLSVSASLLFLALANAYNLFLKRKLIIGNVLVAFLTSFPLAFGAMLAASRVQLSDGFEQRLIIYWAMIFLAVLAREIAKGIADVEGDAKVGVATVANRLGRRTAAIASLSLYAISSLIGLLPPLLGLVNAVAYLTFVLPAGLMVMAEAVRLARRPEKEVALSHKKRVLLLMAVSMVGLYLGAILR